MPQQDFNAAERQAIMRAQEMYRRATGQQEEKNEPVFHKQPSANSRNDMPKQNFVSQQNRDPTKGFFGNSFGGLFDGDMKLLIAMMLLLSGDGGDMLLLLALMYIML